MIKNKNGFSGAGIALVVIAFFALISIFSAIGTYNSLVNKDIASENSWAKVQTAYERRLDLIPNLVATVKGSANFEKETQTQVAALRSGISNAKSTSDLNTVGAKMNSLVSGILLNVEAYPELKSATNFLALQDELAGTENRIKWERDNYNDAVKDYKQSVRRFPVNIIAGMFGFEVDKWEMFEANDGAENPPIVSFE